ncbi:hypothetical protein HPB47_024745, partial [Ixodes persulcatus]
CAVVPERIEGAPRSASDNAAKAAVNEVGLRGPLKSCHAWHDTKMLQPQDLKEIRKKIDKKLLELISTVATK